MTSLGILALVGWWPFDTGSNIGIAGIAATAIVGVTLYLMQRRADKNVNKIIQTEYTRRKERKSYWCRETIHELEKIKELNNNAFDFLNSYSTKQHDPIFIERMKRFFLMGEYSLRVNYIPFMYEAGLRLMDLVITVEPLGDLGQ